MRNYTELLKKIIEKEKGDKDRKNSNRLTILPYSTSLHICEYSSAPGQVYPHTIMQLDEEDITYFKAKCMRLAEEELLEDIEKQTDDYWGMMKELGDIGGDANTGKGLDSERLDKLWERVKEKINHE